MTQTPIFESLFIPHLRPVFCKECRHPVVKKVKLRFSQYRVSETECEPVYDSGYWETECDHNHRIKQRVDHNVAYILNNPDDFVQYGDPRFAKIYPVQYEKMRREELEKKQEAEMIEEATEIADKELVKTYGGAARDALALLKEKHPDFYKVKARPQPKGKRTGIKPSWMK